MTKTKPNYQYESGAYSTSPAVRPSNGGFLAEGSIECWRGSPQDLQRAVSLAIDALRHENITSTTLLVATDWAGINREYDSIEDWVLREAGALEELGTLRIEISAEGLTAAVVARRKIPGITTMVQGSSQLRVDGLAGVIHGALMRGYVDRLGGWWRLAAAMAITLIPAGLFYGGISATADEVPVSVTVLASVAALVVCFFIMAYGFHWTSVRTPVEFVPDDAGGKRPIHQHLNEWRRHPRIAPLVALAGVVLVSVLANKLSDLIPWP